MHAPARHRSIPTLDGWRAIAVLWVCCFHATEMLFQPGGLMPFAPVQTIAAQGYIGVDIFFGLSGFLITTLLLKERAKTGQISLASFYIRRTFRILPAAWVYLAVIAVLAAQGLLPALQDNEITSSLLFWRNYASPGRAAGHFWTLAVEEHFYLVWPALFFVGIDRGKLLRVAIAVAVAVALWRVTDSRYHVVQNLFPAMPDSPFRTDIKIDAILWGCVAALAFEPLKQLVGRIGPLKSQILAAALAGTFALLRFFGFPFSEAGLAMTIPLMIVATVVGPATVAGRFLDLAPIRYIGRISYSLYLWQQIFLYVWPREIRNAEGYGLLGWSLLAGAALSALASYYLVEQPMIAVGRRLNAR